MVWRIKMSLRKGSRVRIRKGAPYEGQVGVVIRVYTAGQTMYPYTVKRGDGNSDNYKASELLPARIQWESGV